MSTTLGGGTGDESASASIRASASRIWSNDGQPVVVEHEERPVGRHQVDHGGRACTLDGHCQVADAPVQCRVDRVAELDDDALVAGRQVPRVHPFHLRLRRVVPAVPDRRRPPRGALGAAWPGPPRPGCRRAGRSYRHPSVLSSPSIAVTRPSVTSSRLRSTTSDSSWRTAPGFERGTSVPSRVHGAVGERPPGRRGGPSSATSSAHARPRQRDEDERGIDLEDRLADRARRAGRRRPPCCRARRAA